MKFNKTQLKDVVIIDLDKLEDSRGFFARAYCNEEFASQGLNTEWAQCNTAYNLTKGILRGMHFQNSPHAEVKLVRCTRGAIYDVIVDLREDSPSFKKWLGVELTADNHKMLYVPKGFAHGYLTLEDNSEIFYQVSNPYASGAEGGVRWNDSAFNIDWPMTEGLLISDKDAKWPDYNK